MSNTITKWNLLIIKGQNFYIYDLNINLFSESKHIPDGCYLLASTDNDHFFLVTLVMNIILGILMKLFKEV